MLALANKIMNPKKFPTGISKISQDVLALSELALEFSVIFLWSIVETILRLFSLLMRSGKKVFNGP